MTSGLRVVLAVALFAEPARASDAGAACENAFLGSYTAADAAGRCVALQAYSKCIGTLAPPEALEHEPKLVQYQHTTTCEGYDEEAPRVRAAKDGSLAFIVDHAKAAVFYRHRREEVNVFTMDAELQQLKIDQATLATGLTTSAKTSTDALTSMINKLALNIQTDADELHQNLTATLTAASSTLTEAMDTLQANVTASSAAFEKKVTGDVEAAVGQLGQDVAAQASFINLYDYDDPKAPAAGGTCEAAEKGKTASLVSIGRETSVIKPDSSRDSLKGKQFTGDFHSHGGGYAKKEREYWFPQWSGTTAYRYNPQFVRLGSFDTNGNNVMGITQDWEGYFYTARWGNDNVCKYGPYPSNRHHWCHGLGTTSSGVALNDELGEAYGLRHADDNMVIVMTMTSGDRIRVLSSENYKQATGYGHLHGWGDQKGTTLFKSDSGQHFIDMYYYTAGQTSTVLKHIWRVTLTTKAGNDASLFDGRIYYKFGNDGKGAAWELYKADVYYPPTNTLLACDGKVWQSIITGTRSVMKRKYLA